MHSILTYLLVAALGGTAIVLFFGILTMLKTTPSAAARSNTLMQWRVIAQVIVLIVFSLLLMGRSS